MKKRNLTAIGFILVSIDACFLAYYPKKLKSILLIITSILFWSHLSAQESFRILFDSDGRASPTSAIVDNNDNLVTIGFIWNVHGNNSRDAFIAKINNCGEFSSTISKMPSDTSMFYRDIIQMDNTDYFVTASKGFSDFDSTTMQYELHTLIFDTNLNLLENKKFNYNNEYKIIGRQRLLIEDNGGILAAATCTRKSGIPMNIHDLGLIRFNTEGDTVETRFKHYQRNVSVFDLQKIPSSNNYLIIERITQLFGQFECYILNQELNAVNINYFSNSNLWLTNGFHLGYWYPNKDFILSASVLNIKDRSDKHLGLFRFDTLANITNFRLLESSSYNDEMVALRKSTAYIDQNSIYFLGSTYDYGDCANSDNIELYVIDTNLNQVAYKSFGGDMSYDMHGIMAAKNGDAFIYGTAMNPEEDCFEDLVVYYVSRKEIGLPPVKVLDMGQKQKGSIVYPNPASNIVNIRTNKELISKNSRIRLFNAAGKKIYDYKLSDKGNTIQLDITTLEKGLFIFQITANGQIVDSGKILKK